MNREFKLLSEDMSLLYEGIIHGTRLEKKDINTDKNTYLEIMEKAKYISLVYINKDKETNLTYLFSYYLENTMFWEEKSTVINHQIIDKEGNKIAWEKWEKRMSRSKQYYVEE